MNSKQVSRVIDETRVLAREAATDERQRFNEAIATGGKPVLHTAFGDYTVDYVDADWWYHTHPFGQERSWLNERSFAGCNDGAWADLMKQAGVERHPRWR